MMAESMYDLAFELLDNGTIRLEQGTGNGETTLIDLHPCQLRLLCERAGLLKPQPHNLAEYLTAGHVRRLRALWWRIEELHDDEHFFNELFDRCGSAAEYWQHIRAIYEQTQELVSDLEDDDGEDRNENSVTPSETPKRGRPATGEAMTNAERQKAHRERKKAQAESMPLALEAAT